MAASLKEDVKKKFGDEILLSATAIVDRESVVVPVSPALDIILNGGIPEGSFIVFTGQPKFGKTPTSLDFAATAQKPEYQGNLKNPRQAYYLNIEGRLKKRDLEGIPGLDLGRFNVIGSQQGKILHAEEYLQIAERIINEEPGSILIIDFSVSSHDAWNKSNSSFRIVYGNNWSDDRYHRSRSIHIKSSIRYGIGVAKAMELVTLCVDFGIIAKGGAWYTLTSIKDKPKFQGTEKLRQYVFDNPKVYDKLMDELRETMGVTCKSKT